MYASAPEQRGAGGVNSRVPGVSVYRAATSVKQAREPSAHRVVLMEHMVLVPQDFMVRVRRRRRNRTETKNRTEQRRTEQKYDLIQELMLTRAPRSLRVCSSGQLWFIEHTHVAYEITATVQPQWRRPAAHLRVRHGEQGYQCLLQSCVPTISFPI